MRGITAVIVTLVIAALVGVGAYQLGVAQGLAGAGGAPAAVPAYYYHPFFFGGFGFLFPLLFILFLFFLIRGAFWGWGHRYGGWGRYGYGDPRERLEEWHKQAHGETPREGGTTQTPPSGR